MKHIAALAFTFFLSPALAQAAPGGAGARPARPNPGAARLGVKKFIEKRYHGVVLSQEIELAHGYPKLPEQNRVGRDHRGGTMEQEHADANVIRYVNPSARGLPVDEIRTWSGKKEEHEPNGHARGDSPAARGRWDVTFHNEPPRRVIEDELPESTRHAEPTEHTAPGRSGTPGTSGGQPPLPLQRSEYSDHIPATAVQNFGNLPTKSVRLRASLDPSGAKLILLTEHNARQTPVSMNVEVNSEVLVNALRSEGVPFIDSARGFAVRSVGSNVEFAQGSFALLVDRKALQRATSEALAQLGGP